MAVLRLWLNTPKNARHSLARLIRDFQANEGKDRDTTGFKAIVHAMNVLLSFFQFERDLKVEEAIERFESELEALKNAQTNR